MKAEVTVVGAGPAGSTAAKFLAEKDIKVILIDKEFFPRKKPCGGGLPLRVLQRFPYVKDFDSIETYSYAGSAYTKNLTKVEITKKEPIIAMILRENYDNELVNFAIDKGAEFIDGKAVKDVSVKSDRVKILLDNNTTIESKLVIGADGLLSIVAKKTGLFPKKIYKAVCLCEEYTLKKEEVEKFFSKNRTCYFHIAFSGVFGYAWVFPKLDKINIGIGEYPDAKNSESKKENLRESYIKYINFLKEQKIIPNSIKIRNLCGGTVPLWPLKKTYADRVLLCGDSAGQVNPVTAEGIYYAMSAGQIAADICSKAIEANDYSSRFLRRYQKAWKKDFGKDLLYLLRTSRKMDLDRDKFFKFVNKDEHLSDMLLGIMSGQLSPYEYRWKIVKRYLFLKFKTFYDMK